MRVRVLFFGRLKDIVGLAEDSAELSDGARVEDLFAGYGKRFPELEEFRPSVAAAVNQEYSEWRAMLAAGDEVAFLPPVSGGQTPKQEVAASSDICEIVLKPILAAEVADQVKAPADGAVVVFDGIVRNNSGGRATQFLIYEAYEPMALGVMRELCAEIHRRFAVDRILMRHRLGRLEIGETSVLIAVSAAHRGAAFDACRFAIDTFKKTVPIWKQEHFSDGAVWAEGEGKPSKTFLPSSESIS
jgi:molybdopterin converting factor subunit 1